MMEVDRIARIEVEQEAIRQTLQRHDSHLDSLTSNLQLLTRLEERQEGYQRIMEQIQNTLDRHITQQRTDQRHIYKRLGALEAGFGVLENNDSTGLRSRQAWIALAVAALGSAAGAIGGVLAISGFGL